MLDGEINFPMSGLLDQGGGDCECINAGTRGAENNGPCFILIQISCLSSSGYYAPCCFSGRRKSTNDLSDSRSGILTRVKRPVHLAAGKLTVRDTEYSSLSTQY